MTLEEQIAGLEEFSTANAKHFQVKNSVLATLRKLKDIRRQFEGQRPNENRVVHLLLEVLGEHPPKRPSE